MAGSDFAAVIWGNPLTMEISPFPGMAFCMLRAEKAREVRYRDIDNYRLANTPLFARARSLAYKYLLARQYSDSISGITLS